jgi:two-component system NtrC family response regulator
VDDGNRSALTALHRARVLVVDDDRAVRTMLQVNLSKQGMEVVLAQDPEHALRALHDAPFDLVLTDVKMPGATGLELLGRIRESWPDSLVVVMTGYGSVADAVAAMKMGASDYVIKPIGRDELLLVLGRALENRALRAQVRELRKEIDEKYGFANLIGTTPVMVKLYREMASVAESSAAVLLQGPTGTGKELLAHAIHNRSRRAGGPYIRVNCAAIPETLLESELFGHEKGAFTGAIRQHHGKFEQADGGSLLLDEIGEINLSMQVKLLRVLENGEYQRVGGTGSLKADVRVIAATNRDLRREVQEGRFRADLFYRLNVVALAVPPLRDRRDDIPLLVDHFLKKYAAKNQKPVPTISASAMRALTAYSWPGNVRQLEHAVERAVILGGEEITGFELPEEVGREPERGLLPAPGTSLPEAIEAIERRMIIAALKEAGGVQAQAARRLGLSRSNLNYRIQRLGIQQTDVAYE